MEVKLPVRPETVIDDGYVLAAVPVPLGIAIVPLGPNVWALKTPALNDNKR
jgi:hypothetical protein